MTVVADKKDWKSETCTPAILEENKFPCCGKTMETTGTIVSLWLLKVAPGQQLARTQGYQSCNQQELNFPI